MGRQGVSARLAQAVKDIFGIEVKVELAVAGDQEARVAALREERRKAQEQAYTLAQLQQSAPAEKRPGRLTRRKAGAQARREARQARSRGQAPGAPGPHDDRPCPGQAHPGPRHRRAPRGDEGAHQRRGAWSPCRETSSSWKPRSSRAGNCCC